MGGYTPDEMKATVIDIRNVGGKPAYHYFSNDTAFQTVQNLSATKFMGASFSVHKLRNISQGRVGADVRYNSRVLASDFDVIGKQSDNNYAAAVKVIGGNFHADKMIANWLLAGKRDPKVTGSAIDYFGGTWGAHGDYCGPSYNYPPTEVESLTGKGKVTLPPSKSSFGNWTHISGLTFAEWMKRIAVNYRDVDTLPKLVDYEVSRGTLASKQARIAAKPSLTKRDLKLLMYGTAAYSEKEFKDRGLTGSDCGGPVGGSFSMKNGQPRGGMMWDGLRDWPHNVGGVKRLDELFGKRWRTLGKGGSSGATNKEAVIGYICLPKIEKKGKLIFPGREMILHLHFKNRTRPGHNFTHVHKAAKSIIDQMVPGINGTGALGEIGGGVMSASLPVSQNSDSNTEDSEELDPVDQEEKPKTINVTKKYCNVYLPPNTLSSLQIWRNKNPFRNQVGSLRNNQRVEILSQDGNSWEISGGYIHGGYTQGCVDETIEIPNPDL